MNREHPLDAAQRLLSHDQRSCKKSRYVALQDGRLRNMKPSLGTTHGRGDQCLEIVIQRVNKAMQHVEKGDFASAMNEMQAQP